MGHGRSTVTRLLPSLPLLPIPPLLLHLNMPETECFSFVGLFSCPQLQPPSRYMEIQILV